MCVPSPVAFWPVGLGAAFGGWPLWLKVSAIAVAGLSAVALGTFIQMPGHHDPAPLTAVERTTVVESTTILPTTTSTAAMRTTVLASATTTTASTTPIRLTNPLDIRSACRAAASQLMGRGLTDAEAAEAVALYQDAELEAQQPGATVKAPSLDAFCQSWIRERFPDDVRAYNALKAAEAFNDLLGRTSPSTTALR